MSFICHPTQLEPTDLPRASASLNTRMARDAHHWPRADGHLKRCGKKLIRKLRTTFPLREFACDTSSPAQNDRSPLFRRRRSVFTFSERGAQGGAKNKAKQKKACCA